MSDQNPSAPTPQVIVLPNNASSSAPAPTAPAPKGKEWMNMSEKQFAKRLEEAEEKGQRRLLKDLGIEKANREDAIKQAKEGLLALTKREQVEAEQAKELTSLKAKAARADELEPVFKGFVDEKFASLSEEAQKYIAATTPEDSNARYKAIQEAIKHGFGVKKVTAAEPAKVEPKVAKPATTMAEAGPPTPKPAGTLNHYEKWKELRTSNPPLAAQYYARYSRSIEEDSLK